MPTTCVWLDGIAESVNEKFLCRQFSRFGPVTHAVIDKVKGRAMVYFESMEFAQHAVNEMRGRALAGKKIQVCTHYWANDEFEEFVFKDL